MEEPDDRGSFLPGTRTALVSLKEFFDFLYIAYRISHELCDKDKDNIVLKKRIGWDELRENVLIARLLSVARSDLKAVTLSRTQPETKDRPNKTPTCADVCNCQDCLYEFYESEEGVWSYSSTEECKNSGQPLGGLRVKINRKNHHWKRLSATKQSAASKTPLIKWVCDVLASMAAEVVDEGILDSVLPFIVPNACSLLKTGSTDGSKRITSDKENLSMNRDSTMDLMKDNEIDIQVCDELKKSTKIFKCPQGVLLKKMKYFAGVTAGQKLEDMDISVHCDLSTFEWLMRWVKSASKETLPTLSIVNVIPVLVSAAFLLMEPLISECLMFLKQNIDDVIQTTPTLSCLNDRTLGSGDQCLLKTVAPRDPLQIQNPWSQTDLRSTVLDRLSELMTNIEVESIKDKKDKIHSRLYCKMILNLAKKVPEPNRGHYSSITKLYRCVACDQLLHADYGRFITCCNDNLHVDNNGQMQSDHQLDPEWNLNEYIKGLKMELKTWKKVYWWLWGLCHYLNCSHCSAYYPVNSSHWCSYHPQTAQFPHDDQGENTTKIGKHLCCGEKTYRFEIFPSSRGCQYRSHSPRMEGHAEKIVMIVKKQESLICLSPPRLGYYNEIIKITRVRVEAKEVMKTTIIDNGNPGYFSLDLFSKRATEKLLGTASLDDCIECADREKNDFQDPESSENKVEQLYDDFAQEYGSITMDSSSQSEEDDITDESTHNKGRMHKMGSSECGKTSWSRREVYSERWIPKLPVRFNQDNLRDREERMVENFVKTLTRKGNELNNMPVKFHSHVQHIGRHSWTSFKTDAC